MPDIENAINIAKSFAQKWEGLSSKNAGRNSYYSSPLTVPSDSLLYAYSDSGGVPTIGWGTTVYSNGVKVKLGDTITKEQADEEMDYEMRQKERNQVREKVKIELTDNQYATLIDFAYNAGAGALEYNDLIDVVNSGGDVPSVLIRTATTASGKKSTGVVNRRKDEIQLWNGTYNEAYSYYLRNATTINYAVIGVVIIAMTGYGYWLTKKKI